MLRGCVAALIALLTITACGGSSAAPASHGPTAQSVSVQPSDLPSGLVKCSLSGDIDSFLNKVKKSDPNTYNSTKSEWASAQQKGATSAYTAFYTDSTAHCSTLQSSGSSIGTANYPLVVNFVIQFKDEKSAANAYTNESIFGFSASSLKTGGAPVIEGTKTGLSPNSIVLSASLPPQSYYIAVWQNKTFMVILAMLNMDAAASGKVATSVNSRIK